MSPDQRIATGHQSFQDPAFMVLFIESQNCIEALPPMHDPIPNSSAVSRTNGSQVKCSEYLDYNDSELMSDPAITFGATLEDFPPARTWLATAATNTPEPYSVAPRLESSPWRRRPPSSTAAGVT